MDANVLTVTELAKYLRMKPVTIYKHVEEGRIPAFKVGNRWRFKKSTIDKWIEEKENWNAARQERRKSRKAVKEK